MALIIREADEIFCVYYCYGEIQFHEFDLKAQALYYNIECGKKYTSEDLEKAYLDRKDLFFDYGEYYLKNETASNEFIREYWGSRIL